MFFDPNGAALSKTSIDAARSETRAGSAAAARGKRHMPEILIACRQRMAIGVRVRSRLLDGGGGEFHRNRLSVHACIVACPLRDRCGDLDFVDCVVARIPECGVSLAGTRD